MGAELFVPPRRDDADESIGAFMTRRFGREATTYLAEPLLAGIHAGDVDRLSVRALFPALRGRGAQARQPAARVPKPAQPRNPQSASADGAFKSLPGGLSEMVRALVAALGRRTRPAPDTRASTRITGRGPFVVHASAGEAIERAGGRRSRRRPTRPATLLRDRDEELSQPGRRDSLRVGRDRRARVHARRRSAIR